MGRREIANLPYKASWFDSNPVLQFIMNIEMIPTFIDLDEFNQILKEVVEEHKTEELILQRQEYQELTKDVNVGEYCG